MADHPGAACEVTVTYVTNGTTETWRGAASGVTHQRLGPGGDGHAVNIRLYDEQGRVVRRVSFAEAAIVEEVITYLEGQRDDRVA